MAINKTKFLKTVLLLTCIFGLAALMVNISSIANDETTSSEIWIFNRSDDSNTHSQGLTDSTIVPRRDLITSTTTAPKPTNSSTSLLPQCSKEGEQLVGPLAVDMTIPNMKDIENFWDDKGWVQKGGAWRPEKCQAVSKVAIIIPYRKRYGQLKIFLRHMHPMLKRQLLDYRIMVIEQNGETPFNRAMLFNIGFKESLKLHDFQCFVFHDVDLIPEDDYNYYGCPNAPRHLSVAVDKFQYRLPYESIFGGAGVFKKEHFETINGFSNIFWGWGGEDDDLYKRIRAKSFKLTRPSMNIGRYKMVTHAHKSAPQDPERHTKLENSEERMEIDGLNSLKYDIVKTEEHPLYTQVVVDVVERSEKELERSV